MTPKSFILSVPPKLGETSQFLQSLQTQRLLPSFLYLPLNVSGPHPSAVGFSLLWSPGAAHKGRSEKTGGGVCRLGEGGGCDPSSIQEGPEIIKSGGSTGASSLGFPGNLKAPSAKGKAPESSDTARDEHGV